MMIITVPTLYAIAAILLISTSVGKDWTRMYIPSPIRTKGKINQYDVSLKQLVDDSQCSATPSSSLPWIGISDTLVPLGFDLLIAYKAVYPPESYEEAP